MFSVYLDAEYYTDSNEKTKGVKVMTEETTPKPAAEKTAEEPKQPIKKPAQKEPEVIFIGNKPPMSYVMAVITALSSGNTNAVLLKARGKAIIKLLKLAKDEQINAFVPVKEFDDEHYIVMVTKNGIIKKVNLKEFSNPRRSGIIAVTLKPGDELIKAELTDGNQQIIIATKNGNALRFEENKVRSMGRSATGVRGITLRQDEVIGMVIADDTKTLFTVTENGLAVIKMFRSQATKAHETQVNELITTIPL